MTRRAPLLLLALGLAIAGCSDNAARPLPRDAATISEGGRLYAQHCASCHGAKLEGQLDWRRRLPNGRMPAPPHDATGHTWHHPVRVLFEITKYGVVPPNAPAGYPSDMPAFGGTLGDDEIRATLAFIESRWPAEVLEARAEMLRNARRR